MKTDIFVGSKIRKITIDDVVFDVRNVYDSKYIPGILYFPQILKQITQGYLIKLLSNRNNNVIFCDDE